MGFSLSREARPGHPIWLLAKTFTQTLIFWFLLLFAAPALVFRIEEALGLSRYRFASHLTEIFGSVLFCTAGAVGLVSCYVLASRGRGTPVPFDCPPRLVTDGPYRYVANPMAVSALAQGAGVALYLGSPLVLAYVLAGVLIAEIVIRPWEEADLERRFGDAYRSYRRQVRHWIPRWRR